MNKNHWQRLQQLIGLETDQVTHQERLISALGGFLGIFSIFHLSQLFLSTEASVLIVASMGASAVLLFAVPHGKLSQPWAVMGGHGVSALVGVAIASYVPDQFLAGALAVGIAIGIMYYLRCIHPPGGASALVAVVGGESVHALGYQFILTPVLLNAAIILLIAILFNSPFKWRRYPASLHRPVAAPTHKEGAALDLGALSEDDLDFAVKKMDMLVDLTHDDLRTLYALASRHAQSRHLPADQIKPGHFYSNGLYGKHWAVRQIIDYSSGQDQEHSMLIFKVIAGADRRTTGSCSLMDFARWARYEVERVESTWQRVE